jgi:spermidine synthase
LFLVASMASMSTLLLNSIFTRNELLDGLVFPARVFLSVVIIFFLPAMVLGTISPAAAKMALDRSERVGATIGSVYAWGAVGSIVGTLGTGFWLIAALGTRGVVLAITIGLALIGLALGPRRIMHAIWLALLVALVVMTYTGVGGGTTLAFELGLREGWKYKDGTWYEYDFAREGHYQLARVYDKTSLASGHRLKVLSLDHLIHGYIDPRDPTHLEYGYEKIYAELTHRFANGRRRISALFLGGGSYTLPRWLEATYPGSRVEVAEIDPLVLEANHVAMGLPRDTPIKTICMDARNVVDSFPSDKKFDLIYSDAFNDLSIPFHLTTLEFFQKLARHLAPDGAVLQNIIDDYRSALMLGSHYNTLKRVFKHVYVITTRWWGVGVGRETYVVVGTNVPLKVDDWRARTVKGDLEGAVLPPSALASLVRKSSGRVLTDDDAPVENLLLPVLNRRK